MSNCVNCQKETKLNKFGLCQDCQENCTICPTCNEESVIDNEICLSCGDIKKAWIQCKQAF